MRAIRYLKFLYKCLVLLFIAFFLIACFDPKENNLVGKWCIEKIIEFDEDELREVEIYNRHGSDSIVKRLVHKYIDVLTDHGKKSIEDTIGVAEKFRNSVSDMGLTVLNFSKDSTFFVENFNSNLGDTAFGKWKLDLGSNIRLQFDKRTLIRLNYKIIYLKGDSLVISQFDTTFRKEGAKYTFLRNK